MPIISQFSTWMIRFADAARQEMRAMLKEVTS